MIKSKLITDLKAITSSPYIALHFLKCLYYTNELFCLSSEENNWKQYKHLINIVKKCHHINTKPILNYLNTLNKNLYSSLLTEMCDDKKWYITNTRKENVRYQFASHISCNIKKYEKAAKKINIYCSWMDVFSFIKQHELLFLPRKSDFDNLIIKKMCQEYQFFEIKINLFTIKKIKHIKEGFLQFCTKLGIDNHNLGHNHLALYIKFDSYYPKTSFYINNSIFLYQLSAFSHEWAHYLDERVAYADLSILNKNICHFILNSNYNFYSDLIKNTQKKIKHTELQYYCLYKILKLLIYGKNKYQKNKFYRYCVQYDINYPAYSLKKEEQFYYTTNTPKEYWHTPHEIFARTFDKTIKAILGQHLFVTKNSSSGVYPHHNDIQRILPLLLKFIKKSTQEN